MPGKDPDNDTVTGIPTEVAWAASEKRLDLGASATDDLPLRKISAPELEDIIVRHGMFLRGQTGGARANLPGYDLKYMDLAGKDLRGAEFSGSSLRNANVEGANLQTANLFACDMRETILKGTDLSRADLRGACLRGADLCDVLLMEADLRDGVLLKPDKKGNLVAVSYNLSLIHI